MTRYITKSTDSTEKQFVKNAEKQLLKEKYNRQIEHTMHT